MKTTNPPSGAASLDLPSVSSEVSQWLYLHASLGKGYESSVPYTPAWVITAGVPDDMVHRMKTAENQFHSEFEKSMADDRAELEQLEHASQAAKNNRGVGAVGEPVSKEAQAAMQARIKELRESLARPVFVIYRDWTADRSTFLELLSKSRFRALSFVDEMGVRAGGYTLQKVLASRYIHLDSALITMTGDQSSDSVNIRSSATGGANMLSMRGDNSARFNLMTITTPQAVSKIADRFKGRAALTGRVVNLPNEPGQILGVWDSQIARIIAKVYATENPAHRVTVETSPAWERFLSCDPSDYRTSQAAIGAYKTGPCSIPTLVGCVFRAVVTRRFYLDEETVEAPQRDRILHLGDEDLQLAQAWTNTLMESVTGTKHLSVRAANLEKANAAKREPMNDEDLCALRSKLIVMLQEDADKFIPRTTALRHGFPAKKLSELLARFPDTFEVRDDLKRGKRNYVKDAIVLKEGWEAKSPQAVDGDLAELVGQGSVRTGRGVGKCYYPDDEGPVGGTPTGTPGTDLSDFSLDQLFTTWQAKAHEEFQDGRRPVFPVKDVGPDWLYAVPAVRERYQQTMTLIPSGPLIQDTNIHEVEMWFRNRPDGSPMCAWRESFREHKLHEKWRDKDFAAALERDAGGDL